MPAPSTYSTIELQALRNKIATNVRYNMMTHVHATPYLDVERLIMAAERAIEENAKNYRVFCRLKKHTKSATSPKGNLKPYCAYEKQTIVPRMYGS